MKKMKFLAFLAVFALSVYVVIESFDYADRVRGYDGTGGEVFLIVLPLWILWKQMEKGKQKKKNKQ